MKDPKDVPVDIELSAEECGHLCMGMNATINNHKAMAGSIGFPGGDYEEEILELTQLRDKIIGKLREVGCI